MTSDFTRRAEELLARNAPKGEWTDLIRAAQAASENSYECCAAIVAIAIREDWSRALVREIALGWYGEAARNGDREAWQLLKNYARMANDTEVDAALTTQVVDRTHEAGDMTLPPEVAALLGVDASQPMPCIASWKTIYSFNWPSTATVG